MLFWFVIIYWIISVGIGLYMTRYVHNAKDYAVAGRSLPFYVVTATVFATWFGSETVLGIPASFLQGGLNGVVADPFGASLCLILVGLFFARPLYRMNLLTIGDFYRQRFNRTVEVVTTLCIVISYLGWVGAQIKALGLVFNVLSNGQISQHAGMIGGAATVLVYTMFGGMFAVAITDFIQMIVIVLGLLYIGWDVSGVAGGVTTVLHHAAVDGKLTLLPQMHFADVIAFVAAGMTMMLGSIPQQDVFQRISSSRNEKIAGAASVTGGVMYFCFAFIPMFLAYSATLIDPQMVSDLLDKDSQMILPTLILNHAPLFAQIMFFGALISAIKSCASATLLAPSVTFTENILKPFFPHMGTHQLLKLMRIVVVGFTIMVTIFALNSDSSIYQMVENAYMVTLVAAFVPLVCGLYWKRATTLGAVLSMSLGLITWIPLQITAPDALIPPQMAGLFMSIFGMVAGSLLPQWLGRKTPAHAHR